MPSGSPCCGWPNGTAARPLLAAAVAGVVAERARTESLDPAILRAAAHTLTAPGDLAGGLLTLALARAGERLGWPAPFRQMVLELLKHPDPEVREAARGTMSEFR
jgi:hypothetical protein